MKEALAQAVQTLMDPSPTALDASGFRREKVVHSDAAQLAGIGLVAAVLKAEGVHLLKVGADAFVYVDGQGKNEVAHVVSERPSAVRTFDARSVIEELGQEIAEEHNADLAQVNGGVECRFLEVSAVGATPGEAAMRAWLLHLQSQKD